MPRKQRLASEAHAGETDFTPPYPPSWFDGFTDWVDRLPGPAWAFYLFLAAAMALAETVIQWKEGAFPVGTFHPVHLWTVSNIAYLLGVMHYLDKSAASAIVSFRPLLIAAKSTRRPAVDDQSKFADLSYRLTTLPPRPALIATIAGVAFAVVVFSLQPPGGAVPTPLMGTARTVLSTASVLAVFIPMNGIAILFLYHAVHQLRQVSRIYTRHARINVYQLHPLYALSRPGAFTALGLIAYIYIWTALGASLERSPAPVENGLALVSVAIAGAAFVLPLQGAHRRLTAEKEARLAEATSRFEAATIALHSQLDRGRLLQMDHLNKALASLEIEQNALRKIPTWPWQPGAIRAVVAALLLPVAVWAIQTLLGRVLGA